MELLQLIRQFAEEQYEESVRRRRILHQYPELSFQELQTSAFIRTELDNLSIPYVEIANTGVLGWIDGAQSQATSDKVVVLRADIDALPIEELNEVDYRSKHVGVMHACGHDFHTSNLISTGAVLMKLRHYFTGRILLLFQPAEERIPGGAKSVLASEIFVSYAPKIKACIGLHVSPQLDVGKIGVCAGKFMASSDELYIRIVGKGGHAAEPHKTIDPICIGVQLISALQQVVSRRADPTIPSVLTFGRFVGEGAANVIPNEVAIAGTFRTMDENWRKEALDLIDRLVNELPRSFGADVDFQVKNGYPFLFNDLKLTVQLQEALRDVLQQKDILSVDKWMAAEDFAYYSQQFSSCFFLVGVRNETKRHQFGLHHPQFDLDEESFLTATQCLIYAGIKILIGE